MSSSAYERVPSWCAQNDVSYAEDTSSRFVNYFRENERQERGRISWHELKLYTRFLRFLLPLAASEFLHLFPSLWRRIIDKRLSSLARGIAGKIIGKSSSRSFERSSWKSETFPESRSNDPNLRARTLRCGSRESLAVTFLLVLVHWFPSFRA